ncbi:ABC transporter ATP-binding protein [Carboxydochorda subterranea]|uniref:ABC transporter ATP-binding protein n=1 Tax=Carboxydichorda subterranea TaxID=3109565 RepID=A0ABZ1BXX6_9FIRM|nr:ABC transporter ATP-binding protein [Limnochorda sp. L945t]WRP17401.1 ABC transporter ATP-binding protein [Limnochorda sp. L945t]
MTPVTGRLLGSIRILNPTAPESAGGGMCMLREADTSTPRTGVGEAVVVVHNLVKRYGSTTAVDHVSFDVLPGEVFGLLGPNGAGKTTTLEIISGLRRPESGDVRVGGISVRDDVQRVQRMLGIVPQGLALYEEFTARQNLSYFASLRGLSRAERKRQIEEVLAVTGLEEVAGKRVAGFSGGMKCRRTSPSLCWVTRKCCCWTSLPWASIPSRAATSSTRCCTWPSRA